MQREVAKLSLTGAALSEVWSHAHDSAPIDARALLSVMHRRGLRVGLAQN